MIGVSIIVLVIAQPRSDPVALAFERAARGVLGPEAKLALLEVEQDPPDDESAARAAGADGVIELSWTGSGESARIHCYIARDQRWVDREIQFSPSTVDPHREASERGRLLGLAAATMFSGDADEAADTSASPSTASDGSSDATAAAAAKPAAVATEDKAGAPPASDNASRAGVDTRNRVLEFAGTFSAGIHGTAAGLGASAGARLALAGPLWARFFASGRAGSIPEAQATTLTVLGGAGLCLGWRPAQSPFELGVRLDGFVSYFQASHLSEDDVEPDRQSRWLPGADLLAEAGVRFTASAGLFLGGGLEAVPGRTEIYTHGVQVAVVPPLRALGEFGFRAQF
ncbi:MAG TPA: hypothetical protein VIW29_17745 [Polyangiaceae bacterium]